MVKQASLPVDSSNPHVRRSHLSKELLDRPKGLGIDTVYDVFPVLAKKYGDRKAAGYRDVIATVEEEKDVKKIVDGKEVTEKKKWKYFTLSDYKFLSYNEVFARIEEVASGLRHLGIQEGSRVGIYADTSVNWQIAAHGSTRALLPITTAYPTLGLSGLAHSLTEPEVQAVFTNAALLPTLETVLLKGAHNVGDDGKNDDKEGGGEDVRFVIYDGKIEKEGAFEKLSSHLESKGGKLLHLDELRATGKANPGDFSKKPSRDDTFCIMYTSGSTGAPKGVVLSHGNIISSLGGTMALIAPILVPDDTFLAFLPLSHILEMLVELTFYTTGTTLGYGGVKTLTDASVRNCEGDLKAWKPSIIVGVPAIFETIRKGIIAKVNAASPVAKGVFNLAFALKKNVPMLGGVADAVVFSKVSEQTGGRLRVAMNGGSALSKTTQEFLTTALMTTLQGYGLTETCGMAAVLVPEFWSYGSVGGPVPSVEIKLQDHPDAGYLTSNNPPQGEVLLGGGSVFKGYFKRPDLDAEAFTADGYFRTGDIGQFNENGTLTLIDRIKNLVKLSSGEYVALESLESVYKGTNGALSTLPLPFPPRPSTLLSKLINFSSSLPRSVLNNLCLYADSEMTKPIAIATLHEANLRHFLKGKALPGVDSEKDHLDTLAANPKVVDAVLKEINAVGKKAGLKGAEVLGALILDPEEWTPENGLTTAAQKLNRQAITKAHKAAIKKVSS
ncbi:long-chain-fatty-acid-CoA-ligase [Mrakia frigida]|uniref:long-chain-fatty-acid-CoA-ligase n=1 Tax=Mrakia frigida TaxID=29902 RepID=UPI003FCC17E3